MLSERLPRSSVWKVRDFVLEWNFRKAISTLNTIRSSDLIGGNVLPEWKGIYLFGEQRYANGGGAEPFVGVEAAGRIVTLDVESSDAASIQPMNSSTEQFIDTFLIFESALGRECSVSRKLVSQARCIDPELFSSSFWARLSEYVLEA